MPSLHEKIQAFRRFWSGQGPSLILIPTGQVVLYDTDRYRQLFERPEAMWRSEMDRAEPVVDWPTDGIPTVRPNLGVVFVPSLAGLGYKIQDGQMPWPGTPLSRDAIRTALRPSAGLCHEHLLRLAAEFYDLHRRQGSAEIVAYHADTQGVLDVAHLLYGESLFYELPDPDQRRWVEELLDAVLELYVAATRRLKELLGEPAGEMLHGHGTPQGVYFPHAGARIAEDTATLLSPRMIDELILPRIERCLAPFGGGFAHFCGYHPALLDTLCRCPAVRAIDLGNPEMYDPRDVLRRCAETDTVLLSRLAGQPDETWQPYTRRLAGLVRETGARVILRPTVFPTERSDCAQMQALWHAETER